MTTFEITLFALIIVFILVIGLLSVPSEKGKQMHEARKGETRRRVRNNSANNVHHIEK